MRNGRCVFLGGGTSSRGGGSSKGSSCNCCPSWVAIIAPVYKGVVRSGDGETPLSTVKPFECLTRISIFRQCPSRLTVISLSSDNTTHSSPTFFPRRLTTASPDNERMRRTSDAL